MVAEKRAAWVVLVGLALLVFVAGGAPYWQAFRLEQEKHLVFGGGLLHPEDTDTYQVFSAQAARGQMLFSNPAADSDRGGYVNLVWLGVGGVMAATGLSFAMAFQVLRFLGALALLVGLYAIARILLDRPRHAIAAVGVTAICSGLGWASGGGPGEQGGAWWSTLLNTLYYPLFKPLAVGSAPGPDIYTDTAAMSQMLYSPHAALAVGMMLLAAAAYWRGRTTGRKSLTTLALILLTLLVFTRLYEAVVLLSLMVLWELGSLAWGLARRDGQPSRLLAQSLPTLGGMLPALAGIAYYYWLFYTDTQWSSWGQGNRYPAPAPGVFHTAYFWGLWGAAAAAVALALYGLRRAGHGPGDATPHREAAVNYPAMGFVLVWVGVHGVALYGGFLHSAWRTCAALGSLLPLLGCTAAVALHHRLVMSWPKRRHVLAGAFLLGLVVVLPPMTASNLRLHADITAQVTKESPYLFMPAGVDRALAWAADNLPAHTRVLAHGAYSLKLPAYGPLSVVLWHRDIMPEYQHNLQKYMDFYRLGPSGKETVMHDMGARMVLYGPADRRRGPQADLDKAAFLEKIYDNGTAAWYMARPADDATKETRP